MSETQPTFDTIQEAWDFAVSNSTIRNDLNKGKTCTLTIRQPTKKGNQMHKLSLITAALLVGTAMSAHATLTWNATPGGGPDHPSVSVINFDGVLPPGVALSFTGVDDAGFRTGSNATHAAPFGDTTQYVTSGANGDIVLSFDQPQTYAGLNWGTVDAYNTFRLYSGTTLVGTLTGSDITSTPNGDRGSNGTFYVNIHSDTPFDRWVASSTSYAFELDNAAYNTSVTEPAGIAMLGVGLLGLGFVRNRRFVMRRIGSTCGS